LTYQKTLNSYIVLCYWRFQLTKSTARLWQSWEYKDLCRNWEEQSLWNWSTNLACH